MRIHDVGNGGGESWAFCHEGLLMAKKHSAFFLGSPGCDFVSPSSSIQEKAQFSASGDLIQRLSIG